MINACSLSLDLATRMRLALSVANFSANALPIPWLAPVMSMILSFKFIPDYSFNFGEDGFNVLYNLVVPKSEFFYSVGLQELGSVFVIFLFVCVTLTI